MKRLVPILLAACLLLAGCGKETPLITQVNGQSVTYEEILQSSGLLLGAVLDNTGGQFNKGSHTAFVNDHGAQLSYAYMEGEYQLFEIYAAEEGTLTLWVNSTLTGKSSLVLAGADSGRVTQLTLNSPYKDTVTYTVNQGTSYMALISAGVKGNATILRHEESEGVYIAANGMLENQLRALGIERTEPPEYSPTTIYPG